MTFPLVGSESLGRTLSPRTAWQRARICVFCLLNEPDVSGNDPCHSGSRSRCGYLEDIAKDSAVGSCGIGLLRRPAFESGCYVAVREPGAGQTRPEAVPCCLRSGCLARSPSGRPPQRRRPEPRACWGIPLARAACAPCSPRSSRGVGRVSASGRPSSRRRRHTCRGR
jgi:hypothetical protein